MAVEASPEIMSQSPIATLIWLRLMGGFQADACCHVPCVHGKARESGVFESRRRGGILRISRLVGTETGEDIAIPANDDDDEEEEDCRNYPEEIEMSRRSSKRIPGLLRIPLTCTIVVHVYLIPYPPISAWQEVRLDRLD